MLKDASQLLNELESDGIQLWIDDGNLRYRAKKGSMTDFRLSQLREFKSELIAELESSSLNMLVKGDPSNANQPFPLTDIQAAYLLGRRDIFDYGGVGCHGYLEFREQNRIDVSRLELAWRRLIDRHPMLRATFSADGTQRVLESVPAFKVELTEADEGFENEVQAQRRAMSHKVYDGASWPLFGVSITQGKEQSVLHISFDLLVADYVSFGLLLDELAIFYDNTDAVLEPIGVSFRDYIFTIGEIKEKANNKERYEADRKWWLERVSNFPLMPELPLAFAERGDKREFKRCNINIDASDWNSIKRYSIDNSITASTALLAVYCEVIAKWSRTERFTIALPLFDRQPLHAKINQVVGDFTSLTLFAVDHSENQTFLHRAREYQNQLWSDLDHRAVSGVEVGREIARHHGHSNTLFPIVFTSTVGQGAGSVGVPSRWAFNNADYGITQTPQVWLDCQVFEVDSGLSINLDYRSGVFQAGVVEAIAEAIEGLLRDLAKNEAHWRSEDSVRIPEQQHERRKKANATKVNRKAQLLHEKVIHTCLAKPTDIALIKGNQTCSFGELYQRAQSVAWILRQEFKVKNNDLIAVVLPKSFDQIAAVLGVLMAGAAYVPIDSYQPVDRRSIILEDASIRLAITDTSRLAQSWPSFVQTLDINTIRDLTVPSGFLHTLSPVEASDVAYAIYTGGSTGTPKGVVISHQAAENTIDDMCDRLSIQSTDIALGLSHLGFDLSVFDIFAVLGCGGTLVIPEPDRLCDPSHWFDLVQNHRVTLWNSVPAQMQMLVDYATTNHQGSSLSLRYILMSGDWIPIDLPDHIRTISSAKQLSLGGATEAAIWSIAHPIESVDMSKPSIPYGRAMRNQEIYVLDRSFCECPDWVPGMIYIGGIGLADGYLADDKKTKESFFIHPYTGVRLYRTGDVGRYNDQGEVELLGREDLQIKIRGHRIELNEIESVALSLPVIGAAVAVVLGQAPNQYLALVVERADKRSVDKFNPAPIFDELKRRLPSYMIPSLISEVEKLPLTRNNKVDRFGIVKLLEEQNADRAFRAEEQIDLPRNEIEAIVTEVFAQTLGLPFVGVSDDFMDLGGNSLLAARAVTEIKVRLKNENFPAFDEMLAALLSQRSVSKFLAAVEQPESSAQQQPFVSSHLYGNPSADVIVSLSLTIEEHEDIRQMLQAFDDKAELVNLGLSNAEEFCELSSKVLVNRFVDACFDEVAELVAKRRVILLAFGNRALAALELARRLNESHINVISVVMFAALQQTENTMEDHWRAAVDQYIVYPYTGDVVIKGDLNVGFDWETVAYGDMRNLDDSFSLEKVIEGLLDD